MNMLKMLFKDQTWVAHLVGLSSITATQLATGNTLVSGIIAALTAVFQICQTFGNGTAVPGNYVKPDVAVAKPTFGEPRASVIFNASGDTPLQP